MDNERKQRLISLSITIVFHALIVILLLIFGFPKIEPQEESGILVMVGYEAEASGTAPAQGEPMVQPAESAPTPAVTPPTPPTEAPPMISQEVEEAPAIAEQKKEQEKSKEEEKRKQEEAQRLAEEQRRAQEAEAERQRALEEERKRQEEAIRNLAANAFGNTGAGGNAASSGTATTGDGVQGSPNGNSTSGATSGSPGWGSYDLGGRGLRGSLPKPAFNVNSSGIVVVTIAVNASGDVTAANISPKGTTTTDRTLRDAALSAARKTRFETKAGTEIQYGTITYRFDSDN